MRPETGALLIALLALDVAADDALKPGVKRICVPSADGQGWVCGTHDNPPTPTALPPRESEPPPPFLMNPEAFDGVPTAPTSDMATEVEDRPTGPEPLRTDAFPPAPERPDSAQGERGAEPPPESKDPPVVDSEASSEPEASPVSEAAPVPIVGAPPRFIAAPPPMDPLFAEPASEPVVETTPDSSTETAPEPMLESVTEKPPEPVPEPDIETVPEPVMETAPEPVPEPFMGTAPDPAAQPVAEPVPEPVTEPVTEMAPEPKPEPLMETLPEPMAEPVVEPVVESAPEPASAFAHEPPRGATDFLLLSGNGHTVQLAHGPSRDAFAALVAELGLAPASTYALPLARDGAPWWVLVWSSFADADSARAALDALPRAAGLNAGWPRRIAPIQDELRAATH